MILSPHFPRETQPPPRRTSLDTTKTGQRMLSLRFFLFSRWFFLFRRRGHFLAAERSPTVANDLAGRRVSPKPQSLWRHYPFHGLTSVPPFLAVFSPPTFSAHALPKRILQKMLSFRKSYYGSAFSGRWAGSFSEHRETQDGSSLHKTGPDGCSGPCMDPEQPLRPRVSATPRLGESGSCALCPLWKTGVYLAGKALLPAVALDDANSAGLWQHPWSRWYNPRQKTGFFYPIHLYLPSKAQESPLVAPFVNLASGAVLPAVRNQTSGL